MKLSLAFSYEGAVAFYGRFFAPAARPGPAGAGLRFL